MGDDEQLLMQSQLSGLRAFYLDAERSLVTPPCAEDGLAQDAARATDARVLSDTYRERIMAEEMLRRRAPRLAAFWGIAPATCSDVERTLAQHKDVSILHYFICEEQLLIFLTTASGTAGVHSRVSKRTLIEQVARFRKLVEMHGRESIPVLSGQSNANVLLDDLAQQLYDALIAPVEPLLPTGSRLCIIPHGVLHYLPFNAFRAGDGEYLIDRFDLFYTVSYSIFDWCYNQPTDQTNHKIVALANSSVRNKYWNLPLAEEQARNLAARYSQTSLFVGEEANKEAFWQSGPGAGILALDVHNLFNQERPLDTALYLSARSNNSGVLSVREIYQKGKGSLGGRLAVAAVCDGNLGESAGTQAEDELTTLARAFHYAGFPTVVTSLWRVHDLSAWLLMENFYDELLQTSDKQGRLYAGKALRKAQLHLSQMRGGEALDQALKQRENARIQDPTGLRAAWIDLYAIGWIEAHSGNFAASRMAYERARNVFSIAEYDYKELLDAIEHDIHVLERLIRQQSSPDYDRFIFNNPYYWAAFILLGRWEC
jgi:CHAT domain-containing protein